MIIHRIVESLRTGRISIFAAELIIVVVGVFLGIQASNWNEARVDRVRANAYLERIRSDLDADLISFDDRLRFWGEVSVYGEQALAHANSGSLQGRTEWQVLLAYFQASQLGEHFTTRSTYIELISGGELGLIRDLELREQLASYYTYADNTVLSERPAYRVHVRGLIPLHIQRYIWKSCYSTVGDSQVFNDCKPPVAQEDYAEIIDRLGENTQLITELRYWMSTMQVAAIMATDRARVAKQLRKLVGEKIGG